MEECTIVSWRKFNINNVSIVCIKNMFLINEETWNSAWLFLVCSLTDPNSFTEAILNERLRLHDTGNTLKGNGQA